MTFEHCEKKSHLYSDLKLGLMGFVPSPITEHPHVSHCARSRGMVSKLNLVQVFHCHKGDGGENEAKLL